MPCVRFNSNNNSNTVPNNINSNSNNDSNHSSNESRHDNNPKADKGGRCELCNMKFRKLCTNEKCEDHLCDQNDVFTLQMLKKDSKS